MKKLIRFFLKLLLLLTLIVGILFISSKLLEEKIVEKAIGVINNNLDVPVYVKDISFSLLKKFPEATLLLHDVTVLSGEDFDRSLFEDSYADTLLYFKELYLSMNMFSLIDKRLNIIKAYAHEGQINALVDKKGRENYKIFTSKNSNSSYDTAKTEFAFQLNQIQFKQIEIRFENRYKNTKLNVFTSSYTVKGSFYKKEYSASSKGKLLLNYFEQDKLKIQFSSPANITMNLQVKNNVIEISKSSLLSEAVQLYADGRITFNNALNFDLKITGNSNNINTLFTLIAPNYSGKVSTNGNIGVSAVIKGTLSNKTSPAMAANFKLINGSFNDKKQNIYINNIEFSGTYSNGEKRNLKTTTVNVNNFLLSVDSSSITGKLRIKNLIKPYIEFSASTKLHLPDFDKWIKYNYDFLADGIIEGKIKCRGEVNLESENWLKTFYNLEKNGELVVNNGMLKIKEPLLNIQEFNSKVTIIENSALFKNMSGNIQNSTIEGDGSIADFLINAIDSTAAININVNFKADEIRYSNFSHFFESDSTDNSITKTNVSCQFETERVYYEKLEAKKAKGKMYYIDDELRFSNLEFQAFNGNLTSYINYKFIGEDRYLFQMQAKTKNVNIKSMFTTFDNFGQTFIKDENIDGSLTSNFDFEFIVLKGKVIPSSIELLGYARVENGMLLNFDPINEVSKFSDIEELSSIEFSTLENDILISNNTIHIPKMKIISNAFDVSLYGSQKFSGDYEYHFKIYLSDFMGGKSKRLAKQQSEFGYIEDDGFGKKTLFLVATNKNNISKVKLDKKEIVTSFKSGLKSEKREIKKALHDEFGWFKNDTTLKVKEKPKQEFIIEWDEE